MGYLCDFCGEQRSIVYCRSDAANLCLSCDRNVHSANALSKRHSRTLSCEKCNSQPAFVRCIEERISLCQNCDWIVHVAPNTSTAAHKRQAVNCYSGCPSAAELSTIWSFLLESLSAGDSTCEQGVGSMSITDNRPGDCQGTQGKINLQDESAVLETSYPRDEDVGMGSMPSLLNSKLHNVEQMAGYTSLGMPKVLLPGVQRHAVCEDDDLYGDLNMDEIDLNMENYEDIFGVSLNDQDQFFENDGMGGLFGTKEMSGCGFTAEWSLAGGKVIQPACSTAASADSVASCKTEPNLCCTMQAHSGISFSGINEECNTGEYQDCGASSMLIMGEPPWYPPGAENPMPSSSRNDAVMRYMEKKKTRKFEKKVRYASRKARADVRRRVKGRFVKAGDAYDYDPLSQTRSY